MAEIKFQELNGQVILSKKDFNYLASLANGIIFIPSNSFNVRDSEAEAYDELDFWKEEIEEKVWNEV